MVLVLVLVAAVKVAAVEGAMRRWRWLQCGCQLSQLEHPL
jgi:hypothetical protein